MAGRGWRGGQYGQYDGRRHGRHHHRRGFGFYGAAPYVPYGYYSDSYVYEDEPMYEVAPQSDADDQYCRRRYRSYDSASGTFLGNDGRRHPCP